jgi:hypothetical protein
MSTTLAHGGLPEGITRFDLLRLFEQVARPGFGLSSTAIALVRHYVLKTLDADYHAGSICAVWTQACRLAGSLGLTSRSVNSAERELERAGFIVRTAGINGGRTGDRHEGVITWAAGINLAPLIGRFHDLKAKAEALKLQARAIGQCRAEIRQLGKRIRDAGSEVLLARAEAILPDGRTARIGSIERLTAIREALSSMLNAIESEPGAAISSDAPEENCAPNIQNHQSSRSRTAKPTDPIERVTPAAAVSVATEEYQGLVAALGGPTWLNIVEASWRTCPRLGIAQTTWGRACQQFGRERAALCVLLIDRNSELPLGHRYRVKSPGRCLSGMTRRATTGSVNLAGLLKASQRDQDRKHAHSADEALSQTPDISVPPTGPLAGVAARIMAGLEVDSRSGKQVDIEPPQSEMHDIRSATSP